MTLQKLTRGSEIDNLRAEIRKSHALLFHRHTASRKLAEKFYSLKLKRMRYLEWSELTGRDAGKWTGTPALMVRCHAREIDADNAPTAKILKEFPLLAPRMVHLLQRMETWRPRTFRELFITAYSTRMDWWVSMFVIIFGVISVLSLVLGIYQAFVGQKQLSVALEALAMQEKGT